MKKRQPRPSVPTLLVSWTDSPRENTHDLTINETISEQTTETIFDNNCEALSTQKRRISHPGNGKYGMVGLTTQHIQADSLVDGTL